MLIYILKFSACLSIFMMFYKLFLEKENMHIFKRFYLLTALAVAFLIPLITFTYYIDPVLEVQDSFQNTVNGAGQAPVLEQPGNYLPILLWSLYGLGVLCFGVKFIYNLSHILRKIKRNPKYKVNSITNVLLQDLVSPHTFFNFIFLNKYKFEAKQIPEEVYLHEQTHAKQKHSIDILFVEILQVLFWFNPLIYFIKKDIKLNHEFLADQAVISEGINPSTYQAILLAFSSNASEPQLANAINYSLIKKRFTVMKTQTKKQTVWLRSLVLLPLLAILVYGFSSREQVEKEIEPEISVEEVAQLSNVLASEHTARSISVKILDDDKYEINGVKASKSNLVSIVNELHQDITPEVRNKIMNIHVSSGEEISNEDVWFIYNSLLEYGFHRIVTDNQEVIRGKGNTPFAIDNNNSQQDKNLQLNFNIQKGATREQMAAYTSWAKKINSELAIAKKYDGTKKAKPYPIIKLKDLEKYKHIYSIMSDKQRKDAEPFPNLQDLPPPPPPGVPKLAEEKEIPAPPPIPENISPAKKAKLAAITKEYAKKHPKSVSKVKMANGKVVEVVEVPDSEYAKAKVVKGYARTKTNAKVADIPPPPPIPENATPEQKKNYEKAIAQYKAWYKDRVVKGELSDIPPPPPPPKSPLDHMIEMAKKDATFYLNGKKTTSDKAINAFKKNKKLNIQIVDEDSDQPKVYITTKPIVLKN